MPARTRDIILPLGALELVVTTDDGTARVIPVPEGATRLTLTFDALAGVGNIGTGGGQTWLTTWADRQAAGSGVGGSCWTWRFP